MLSSAVSFPVERHAKEWYGSAGLQHGSGHHVGGDPDIPIPYGRSRRIMMATPPKRELITYVDSTHAEWRETRPGSRRKVLYEDAEAGQLTMLVQWDPGYQMGVVDTTNTTNICTS